ncbi:MAG: SPOR domain-containing protein, partial [Aquificaceae bacterium]
MKKEKLVVLLGMLMALIFFFLGLNQWLKTKEEVQPPPLVVSPPLAKTPEEPPKVEAPTQEVKREEHKQEEKPIQK